MLISIGFIALWFLVRWVIRRKKSKEAKAEIDMAAGRKQSASRFVYWLSGIFALLAVVNLIFYLVQPSMDGEAVELDFADSSTMPLENGAVSLRGVSVKGPIARSSDDFLFLRQTQYLAPIATTTSEDGSTIFNVFLQVTEPDPAKVSSQVDGLLLENALPPEVAAMYNTADIPTSTSASVIYLSERSAYRRLTSTLAIFVFGALLMLAFGRFLSWRERKAVKDQG